MTLVPSDFKVPWSADLGGGRLRLSTMADLASDHALYVRNRDRLDGVYDPKDTRLPNGRDLLWLSFARLGYCEFQRFKLFSFCYSVMDPDDDRQIGRLHIEPSASQDFDAQAIFWVGADDCHRDAQLVEQVRDWLAGSWPFEAVAMPGRTETWQALTRPLLVPPDYHVPQRVNAEDFVLRLMTMDDYPEDYTAFTSSASEIQSLFNPVHNSWPATLHDNLAAMGAVEWEHFHRLLFTYCVMTPDERRQMGCIYVGPSGIARFDAEVTYWVRKEEYDNGFHDHLSAWMQDWINTSWTFDNPAFPGALVSWEEWNHMMG